MEIVEELTLRAKEFEESLRAYLPELKGYQKTVFEAFSYSLLAGGKRIRPVILLETYKMLAKETSDTEAGVNNALEIEQKVASMFAVALEMIHTYSLVHDDLPAMDNDRYRRGKLTTHAKFGEAMGILAGDALLNYAYEMVSDAFLMIQGITDQKKALSLYERTGKAFHLLSECAGMYGMIGGQVVDVEKTGQSFSKEELEFVYELKTGALLRSAFLIGAILADAKDNEQEQIDEIARNVGLAFQIQDDILDVIGNQEMLGKPIHSDEKNQKTTYVSLYGIPKASQEVDNLSKEALRLLTLLHRDDRFLSELIEYLMKREN